MPSRRRRRRAGIEFVDGLRDLLLAGAGQLDRIGPKLQPLVARQANDSVGVGQVEDQRIVAEHRQAMIAERRNEGGLARAGRAGERKDTFPECDSGGMDREQSVDAGDGGIDAAVEPQRFFAEVQIARLARP